MIAPMMDMMKPAGWNVEPGSGLENKRPIKPPMIEPPTPSSVVIMNPRCCAPGMMARAIQPTMKPTMMYEMMCIIDLF